MRLSEMRKIILENINQLEVNGTQNNNSTVTIKNLSPVVDAIENLKRLGFLSNHIIQLKSMGNIYNSRLPEFSASPNEYNSFRHMLKAFRDQCQLVVDLANSLLPQMEEHTICISLHKTANISDVQKLISNLEEAFSQTSALSNYKGSVRFAGFESGSDWINLIVEGATYLPVVYIMIKYAYQAAYDYNNLKLLHQRYHAAEIQNQVNLDLKNMVSALSNRMVDEITNNEQNKLSPDEVNRLIHGTIKIATVINDGNKVTASLTAPVAQQDHLKKSADQISTQLEDLKLLTSPESVPEQVPTENEPID